LPDMVQIYMSIAKGFADQPETALVTRKMTSPRRLGIYGRSNGGLLMGVEFTQHPEMWNAVVIQVPVLDLMRF